MPGAYARTAAQALTNVTYRYIELLADLGVPGAFAKDPNLLPGLNVANGKLTFRTVADAHGMPFVEPANAF
jgi:alanine dehydrogenase